MDMLLKIYIGFSILTFIVTIMQSFILSEKYKRKYPELVEEYRKKNKRSILEKIFIWTKAFISCFVPIVNIGIFYVSMFKPELIDESFTKEKLGL